MVGIGVVGVAVVRLEVGTVVAASWVVVVRSVGEYVVGGLTFFVGPFGRREVVVVPGCVEGRQALEEVIGMARHGAVEEAAAVVVVLSGVEEEVEEHRSERDLVWGIVSSMLQDRRVGS